MGEVHSPCGAGGSRTLVQTVNRCAFYMLIRWLVVGAAPDIGTQGHPYPLLFHPRLEESRGLSRLYEHLLVSSRRSGRLGDVPFPRLARELSRTYCASVRQRERSCFRQLLFCVCGQGFWRVSLHAYKPIIPAVKTKQPQWELGDKSCEFWFIPPMSLQKKFSARRTSFSVWRSGRDSNSRPHA